jgi:hypothetical protein
MELPIKRYNKPPMRSNKRRAWWEGGGGGELVVCTSTYMASCQFKSVKLPKCSLHETTSYVFLATSCDGKVKVSPPLDKRNNGPQRSERLRYLG